MTIHVISEYSDWLTLAQFALSLELPPEQLFLSQDRDELFSSSQNQNMAGGKTRIDSDLLKRIEFTACHSSPEKWMLFYRLAWRTLHGERHLMKIKVDPDVMRFERLEKSVKDDAYKMKAYVRFQKISKDKECYVAWYRPSHRVLKLTAPFFAIVLVPCIGPFLLPLEA